MSALDDDVDAQLAARRDRLSWCRAVWRKGQPDSKAEHRRRLALEATECLTGADVIALRLRALGVDTTAVDAALDAAHEAIVRASIPVLIATPPSTPEQAEGRKR